MKWALQFVLRGYKRFVSPMLPPACRFVPTCSEFAQEAVERYGVIRGGALATWRLLRCHPLARGGYDPVPQESCCAGKMQVPRLAALAREDKAVGEATGPVVT